MLDGVGAEVVIGGAEWVLEIGKDEMGLEGERDWGAADKLRRPGQVRAGPEAAGGATGLRTEAQVAIEESMVVEEVAVEPVVLGSVQVAGLDDAEIRGVPELPRVVGT